MTLPERQSSSWRSRMLSFWRSLAPELGATEPSLVELEDSCLEFRWKGRSVQFDPRRRLIFGEGRVPASFDQVLSVDIERSIDEDRPDQWTVLLRLAKGANLVLGSTTTDVDASIAAAKVATVLGAQVRSI